MCEQMSEVVGFELKPQPDTNLSHMIEYGLSKHLDRSAQATVALPRSDASIPRAGIRLLR